MQRPLVDLSQLNLTEDLVTEEELRVQLPHDHEFKLIDGICFLDLEEEIVVGYKDWDANPWWGRGHIPGRPIMPGVLMIEGCAQVSALLMKRKHGGWPPERFIGLAGVDGARFRGVVTPPCRVHFVAKIGLQNNRIARYPAQAFVDNKMVFEMELMGVPI